MVQENTFVFISDIHANIDSLKRVLNDIEDRGILMSNVYCLGDTIGYGEYPNEVLELLKEKKIISVLGNHDEAHAFFIEDDGITPTNRDFLRNFSKSLSISLCNKRFLLTHGSPYAVNDYIFEDDIEKQKQIADFLEEDVIVFGHTHFQYKKKVKGKLFINPGSVGKPKDGDPRACYAIVRVGDEFSIDFVRV